MISHLKWKGGSKKIVKYSITVFEPGTPNQCGFWHRIVVNININFHETSIAFITNSLQIQNDFESYSYGAPCAPNEDHPHRYFSLSMDLGKILKQTLITQLPKSAIN